MNPAKLRMIIIAITLFAVVGQAAAGPLLNCSDDRKGPLSQQEVLAQIDSNASSSFDMENGAHEQSTHIHEIEQSYSHHADHDNCSQCVSCNTATSNSEEFSSLPISLNPGLSYSNPHLNNAVENPFRPPILN